MRFTLVMLGAGLVAATGAGAIVRCLAEGSPHHAIAAALLMLYGLTIVFEEARS